MELAGFLILAEASDPESCVVLLDNYMTSQIVDQSSAAAWELADTCDECVCETASCGVTAIEEAPWFRAEVPASGEFFGLYGQLRLSQPTSGSVVTSAGARQLAAAKQLVFSGIVSSSSARGTAYGLDWVRSVLDPDCGCGKRWAEVQLWCPETICDTTVYPTPAATPTAKDWCQVQGLNCGEAVPLTMTPDPVVYEDDGTRILPDVEYVPGSFTELVNLNEPIPNCHGAAVTFTLTVKTNNRFLPSTSGGCLIQRPADNDPQPCCTGIKWDMSEAVADCGCLVDCVCNPDVVTYPTGATDIIPDGAAVCTYSTPLCAQQFACLTEPFVSETAVPTITITAGTSDMTNVSVRIWEARPGLADPSTEQGFLEYEQMPTIVDPALIHRIPAQGVFVIDGRAENETVTCPGDRAPASSPAMRCGGRRYRHPTLCCGKRYWVAIGTDCAQGGDWAMSVTINGVERV